MKRRKWKEKHFTGLEVKTAQAIIDMGFVCCGYDFLEERYIGLDGSKPPEKQENHHGS